MFTVTQLAHACGLSRSTVLYYESIGLLQPARRAANNYRRYGPKDVDRLKQICLYRDAGLTLGDIGVLLQGPSGDAASVLQRRLAAVSRDIDTLRAHQRAILALLQNKKFRRTKSMTKEKWVEIMSASGLTQDDMHRWHAQFEKMAPAEHQQFLEYLHIKPQEIADIRNSSRG